MAEIKDTIMNLIEYDSEREWFEFKSNWIDVDELGQYISAISNSTAITGRKIGYVVFGIDDKTHEITGTTFDYHQNIKNEPIQHYLARQLQPDLNFVFEETLINDKRVVLLMIPAAKIVPTAFAKERYIRIGSSRANLRKYPEKESFLFEVLRHGFPTIENTPSEYQELTFEKLIIYYGAKGLKLNLGTFKKNLSLYTEDGKYNILAQLLSDDSHVPIRIAIFSGTGKADTLYSIREFGNQCLLYSLDEVLRYGDILNIIQADEKNRVVDRKDVPLFDYNAFREAVVNAFVHNKWVTGNEPMITVFSDRIEILSRGPIPPEQTLEGFFAGESVPVNRKLSEIFLQLHISEKTGRGVPVITNKYGKTAYRFNENSIVVTIPFNWITPSFWGSGNNREKQNEVFLNKTQQNILNIIEKNPKITKPVIAKELGLGKTSIDKNIAFLKRQGYLERIGSDKTGYWNVIGEKKGGDNDNVLDSNEF